jgi:hypothetical protein
LNVESKYLHGSNTNVKKAGAELEREFCSNMLFSYVLVRVAWFVVGLKDNSGET